MSYGSEQTNDVTQKHQNQKRSQIVALTVANTFVNNNIANQIKLLSQGLREFTSAG